MKNFCVINPKTNRCVTSYIENETSSNCKYESNTKRCSSVKTKVRSYTKKRHLPHFSQEYFERENRLL